MTAEEQVTQAYLGAREDVYRYLLIIGLEPAQAQDATQDVFLRLHQALRKGEAIRSTRAWVFRVAHNLGVNLRVRRRDGEIPNPLLVAELPDGGPDPERRMLERERAQRLADALETLSPQQRICLHLRAEGLRYQEIANTIGVSVSTVSEFLSRAVARLRKAVHD